MAVIYKILSAATIAALEDQVNQTLADSGGCMGAPFYDGKTDSWCQAVIKPPVSKTVKLKESAKP